MNGLLNWRMAGAGVCLLAVVACAAAVGALRTPERPCNVLFISIDALRADHLGCYGYPRATSPAIDSLAHEGAVFTQAFAQRGQTWPSLASIMTSAYPITHGVRGNGVRLDDSLATLATALKENGYACTALLANAPQQNWRGFDHVAFLEDQALTPWAELAMQSASGQPFFVWCHYVAPHAPYEPPEGYRDLFDGDYVGPVDGSLACLNDITKAKKALAEAELNHIVSLYDGEVAFVDGEIRRILDFLNRSGLAENTLIVITADHGEDLYDHNFYFDHSASVYDSTLRIPFILHRPDLRETRRIDSVVESIDIAPTVLELVGIDAPSSFQGESLARLLDGQQPARKASFAEWQDKMVCVRTNAYKYILNPLRYQPRWLNTDPTQVYPVSEIELYDIQADPGETQNLAVERPEVCNELRALAEAWIARQDWKLGEFEEAPPPAVDEEVKRSLQSLGYVM